MTEQGAQLGSDLLNCRKKDDFEESSGEVACNFNKNKIDLNLLKVAQGAHQMEPPSPIQVLEVDPFPSRFINRTVRSLRRFR